MNTQARKTVWIRDDDPRHYATREEAESAALPQGPLPDGSYFQVVNTADGRKFFAWGEGFTLALCLNGAGLNIADRIEVRRPTTYAELRSLKASFNL